LTQLLEKLQIAVALLIVCIPEGLPLAISMSLALSTDRLKDDNLLIKNLKALETAGYLTDIVTSKTSTLTKGTLEVKSIYTHGSIHDFRNAQINKEVLNTINELIILNTDVKIEMDDQNQTYKAVGSPVEVGMIGFLVSNRISVIDRLADKENINKYTLRTIIPFSSTRKRMAIAFKISDKTVRVVVKGAPEEIMILCTHQLNSQHQEVEFS